jgi:tellurite resistance protein TerC
MPELFPFEDYWWLYATFVGGVLVLLGLDLGVLHRDARAVGLREAAAWTAVWVSLALAFNVALYFYARWAFVRDGRLAAMPGFDADAAAWQTALEFLTGYVVEYSLSVDNIFVFVLVLGYFSVPPIHQHRVLFYGILGALVFRGIFVALGSVLMQYQAVVIAMGVLLIVSGVKMLWAPSAAVDPGRNPVVRLVRRVLPVTPALYGQSFFTRVGGRWHATPLLIALLVLELSDIVFAVDSVPAIFGITGEPLIVFTSNVCAILGLRAMYFLLAGAVERFHLLHYGLALILVFVGLKMVWLNDAFGGKFPIEWSLAIIGTLLTGAVGASLLIRARPALAPAREARPELD